jgi:hypothetical protein
MASIIPWAVFSSYCSLSDFIYSLFWQYWDLDAGARKHCTLELHSQPVLRVVNFSDSAFYHKLLFVYSAVV